jgi:hypothetical protein
VRCAPSSQPQARGGKVEAVPGDVPEGLVAARQAADEAVFDLLLAPQLGKRRPLARKQLLGQQAHRDVEERAEGIERDGLDAGLLRHAGCSSLRGVTGGCWCRSAGPLSACGTTSLLLQCSEVYSMHKEKRSHNKIK